MAKHKIVKNQIFLGNLKLVRLVRMKYEMILKKYFVDNGISLAKNIPNPSIPFGSFLKKVNTTLPSQPLSTNELKDAFFFSENKQKSWC